MNKDIISLLYRIKENISFIESNGISMPVLDEIESDFLEMLELIKLFMISERDSYYGYFMMNLTFSVNFEKDMIAGILLNQYPPVFESNPLLLCKFSLKEIMYIFCHEIEHIILNHPAEMIKANPTKDPEIYKLFNIAADASVNERINKEIKDFNRQFLKMPHGVITSRSIKKMFNINNVKPLENYKYYYGLIENQNTDGIKDQANSILKMKDEDENGEETTIVTANNCGQLSDHLWEMDKDVEDVTSIVREFVNTSTSMMNEETRGLLADSFLTEVEKLNQPPVLPWQKILKKYIGTIAATKEKTKTRLNRRQPQRFDLSGTYTEKILKIVVAIDTSGSMSDEQIAYIFNEMFAILSKKKYEMTVIECDSKVQRVYKVRKPSDIKLEVLGRGGTEFTPVIEYINKDKYFRDALLIYFTDGYGEDEIPRPRTYRNLWVLTDNSTYLSVKEPYGMKITM